LNCWGLHRPARQALAQHIIKKGDTVVKKFLLIIGIIFCFTPNLFATTVVPLTCTNSSSGLPSGLIYGWVTLESQSSTCVEITVQPNTAILNPGPNFGIQLFGFNYKKSLANIVISGLPTGWTYSLDPKNISGFGEFKITDTGSGSNRQTPLVFTVCCISGTIAESDLVEPNPGNYSFAAHIAGFTNTSSGSAFFADGCPLNTTTTTVQPTTTTSVLPTTTTTSVLPTTTTVPPTTTTTVPTTLIELSTFNAIPGNKKVTLEWVTETEIDNAGFNIYRAEEADGEYVQINEDLIPANGSSMEGASYLFIDNKVKNRKAYYYKLEDMDLSGVSMMHGPVSARPLFIYRLLKK